MKLVVGTITYGESTAKYLPYFLASLKEQTNHDFELYVYDNTDDGTDVNQKLVIESGLKYQIFANGTNLGFGKAYNVLINEALKFQADYFLAINPDMIFDSKMISELLTSISTDEKTGATVAKILHWDFANQKKSNIIDSLGIISDKYFRFFDDQQGSIDSENLNVHREIFGFTGATVMLRLSALETIAFQNEYFDESMFMYKEDCDLSLRLRLAGWKIEIQPLAVAYHDRTAVNIGQNISQIANGRKFKSKIVKQWSFLNQLILLYKYNRILSGRVKFFSWVYEILSIGYAVFFETYLLRELIVFFRIRKQIKSKSLLMPININPRDLDKYFLQ